MDPESGTERQDQGTHPALCGKSRKNQTTREIRRPRPAPPRLQVSASSQSSEEPRVLTSEVDLSTQRSILRPLTADRRGR
eukprot:15106298-Alexandrium_andersonii.AAC.1